MSLARQQAPSEFRLFDETESELVARSLIALAQIAPGDADILSTLMKQLADLNQIIWQIPSLRSTQYLGGEKRNYETLLEHLCRTDGLEGDLELPVKAVLQRTFLMSKIQFLRAFVKATGAVREQTPDLRPLNLQLREELAQSIYTLMAEDLLLALLRKPGIEIPTKRRAANELCRIWDNCALEIDDLFPMLESAWHARNRIIANLGSLLGASEYFKLVREDCAPQFLDYFAREEVSTAENQAFIEFLFGVTTEELQTLRQQMKVEGIRAADEGWASQVLGRSLEHECDEEHTGDIDPISLYRSYQRRQLAADFRILAKAPGPCRTAEAYLTIYLLNQQAKIASNGGVDAGE
jgi:hypothetical protein